VQRRDLLKAGAGVGGLGLGSYGAWQALQGSPDPQPRAEDGAALARRYAPRYVFDARERWFPTDPRRYTVERDGETVVDGFAALDGYSSAGRFPNPTVWYNVRRLGEDLRAVQFWSYSAFDQFTVNFHWHDWELLQVFVDTAADEPVLLSASAHSRKVPNNEFLDPSTARPTVLAELGSHAAATEVNDSEGFQRLSGPADLTNRTLSVADFAAFPLGYGLPRDEGLTLPVSMPELDGAPVHEHPALPNVTREDLVPPEATVRSFSALSSPPVDIPRREPGPSVVHEGDRVAGDADATYELRPMRELVDEVDDFDGPQLSFEFAVPRLAEDAVASHLTTVSTPWDQPRYESPLADISDSRHRQVIAERYGLDLQPRLGGVVVGAVRTLAEGAGGDLRPEYQGNDAARDRASVSLVSPGAEVLALVQSENPAATVSARGVVAFQDVPEGDHRLTVNGPGLAPYAERFPHDGEGEHRTGVEGRIATVPNGRAVAVGGERPARRLRVEEDYAGPLYDARPPGEGFALYLHRAGAYTLEVEGEDGTRSVHRVNPDSGETDIAVGERTGAASVLNYLAEYLADTAELAREVLEGEGVTTPLDAAVEAAARATELLDAGNAAGAQVGVVRDRLLAARGRVDGLPEDARVLLAPRVERAVELSAEAEAAVS